MKLLLTLSLGCFLACLVDGNSPCGDGWETYKDEKCFKISTGLANFGEAETICNQQNGTLVSIGSPEEQTFLERYLFLDNQVVDNIWLGARYNGARFYWEDGSNLTYSHWLTGSPKYHSGYCVMMQSEDEFKGKWADETCARKNRVVCQKTQALSLEGLNRKLIQMKNEYERTVSELTESKQEQESKIAQLENKLIAASVPLGFIYVQLPKESAPSEIWPSMNWTEVSSTYAGVFFRVEGAKAAEFGTVQQESAPKLIQVLRKEERSQGYPTTSRPATNQPTPAPQTPLNIPSDGSWSNFVLTADNVNSIYHSGQLTWERDYLRFRHSTDEVRPLNMAVKVWKRTA